MKVDVEGHEAHVFANSSAGQFFDHVNVPLVLMEWNYCKTSNVVWRLLNFFYSRNYAAFDFSNFKLNANQYLSWPNNVLFKKAPYLRF